MHTTTIIRTTNRRTEPVNHVVQFDADPASDALKRAVAGFLAGYSGQTMTAYRIDLNKFIGWLDTRGVRPFDAERGQMTGATALGSRGPRRVRVAAGAAMASVRSSGVSYVVWL